MMSNRYRLVGALCALCSLCLSLAAAGCGAGPEPAAAKPEVEARLLKTLEGHTEIVWRVAFSPDGRWLASGSRERGSLGTLWKQVAPASLSGGKGQTVRLWRVSDGALQQALAEHSGDVHSVDFSPDGRLLAGSGEDKTVKTWRLEVPASSARE